jgi:hypothetical protein
VVGYTDRCGGDRNFDERETDIAYFNNVAYYMHDLNNWNMAWAGTVIAMTGRRWFSPMSVFTIVMIREHFGTGIIGR